MLQTPRGGRGRDGLPGMLYRDRAESGWNLSGMWRDDACGSGYGNRAAFGTSGSERSRCPETAEATTIR